METVNDILRDAFNSVKNEHGLVLHKVVFENGEIGLSGNVTGTGAKPGQTGNNSSKVTNNKKARSEMSTREKIDFIKENGQDAFLPLVIGLHQ